MTFSGDSIALARISEAAEQCKKALSERSSHDARQAYEDRLDAEGHCPAIARKRISDDRKGRRKGAGLPGHDAEQTYEHNRPAWGERVRRIATHGNGGEGQQRATTAETVGKPAAGILIEAVEEIFRGAEKSDGNATGAKRGQVRGYVRLPEFFTERQTEQARR